mmetsp:Transcript_15549/g.58980  ORF Transcript_15549/g.58980 Transcript_15549/m.58980 type:complete len:227 (+) Transcript_15549:1890-2570(+)
MAVPACGGRRRLLACCPLPPRYGRALGFRRSGRRGLWARPRRSHKVLVVVPGRHLDSALVALGLGGDALEEGDVFEEVVHGRRRVHVVQRGHALLQLPKGLFHVAEPPGHVPGEVLRQGANKHLQVGLAALYGAESGKENAPAENEQGDELEPQHNGVDERLEDDRALVLGLVDSHRQLKGVEHRVGRVVDDEAPLRVRAGRGREHAHVQARHPGSSGHEHVARVP